MKGPPGPWSGEDPWAGWRRLETAAQGPCGSSKNSGEVLAITFWVVCLSCHHLLKMKTNKNLKQWYI